MRVSRSLSLISTFTQITARLFLQFLTLYERRGSVDFLFTALEYACVCNEKNIKFMKKTYAEKKITIIAVIFAIFDVR